MVKVKGQRSLIRRLFYRGVFCNPEFTITQENTQTFGDKLGTIDRITGRILMEENGKVKGHS